MPIIHVPHRRTVQIKLDKNSGFLQRSGSLVPISVSSQIIQGLEGVSTLEALTDVDITGTPEDGWVLTYDADIDKYVVRAIGPIDSGTF